jgi:hypothetical protein
MAGMSVKKYYFWALKIGWQGFSGIRRKIILLVFY